jgi:hypothetical protein
LGIIWSVSRLAMSKGAALAWRSVKGCIGFQLVGMRKLFSFDLTMEAPVRRPGGQA